MREFWNSLLTEKSWNVLQELKKEHKFILIGGWAIYLFTKRQKSKDIDIVVDINELQKFKFFDLEKNDKLKKYGVRKEEIDIDIYLEHYSKLAIPVEDIKNYVTEVEGFRAVVPEMLLILKQAAYNNRKDSIKGEKDLIDIVSLIFFTNLNFKKYKEILKKYKLETYYSELKSLLKNFKDYEKLDLNAREFKLRKNKKILEMAG